MAVERERILEALRQCYDPEIPINIVDLGLIYDAQSDEAGNVAVKMTLTTQGCPSALAIPEQVRARIAAIDEVRELADVQVNVAVGPGQRRIDFGHRHSRPPDIHPFVPLMRAEADEALRIGRRRVHESDVDGLPGA